MAEYKNISAANTYVLRSTPNKLYKIIVNKPVASSTITIYDNGAASGTKVGTITHPATLNQQYEVFDYGTDGEGGIELETGLTIVTSGADDVTVIYG